MNTISLALIIAFQVLIVAILAVLMHKVRRIHLSSYRLDGLLTAAHDEVHALYAQLESLAALDRTLAMTMPLPPMRGWAGSPDFLWHVAQHLLKHPPRTVVECSSGVSTVIAARCCQLNGTGHVYSLEHEEEYAEKTRMMLKERGLEDWATVLDAPLARAADGLVWYEDRLPAQADKIDVLVIDGPPKATAAMARYPALPRLARKLADDVTIFLDDANRPDERLAVERWAKEYPDLQVSQRNAEKGLTVLTRRPAPIARAA